MDRSPINQVWPKPSCKTRWKGKDDKADRRKDRKTTSEKWQAKSLPSPTGQRRTKNKEQWRRLIVRSSVVSKRPSQLRDRWRWWCMCVCCCVCVRVRVCVCVCVCVCTWNGNSYICSEQSVDSWKAVSNRLWINSINSDVHGQKQTKKSEATAQDSHLPFTSTFIFPYKPNVYFPIQTKFPFITKKQQM